jgi:hypothetical protein
MNKSELKQCLKLNKWDDFKVKAATKKVLVFKIDNMPRNCKPIYYVWWRYPESPAPFIENNVRNGFFKMSFELTVVDKKESDQVPIKHRPSWMS